MQAHGNPHMKHAAKMHFVVTAAAHHSLQIEDSRNKSERNAKLCPKKQDDL